ncbi:uncharacterized protein [Henckelia pumila]|uniref:uncharacterized protein n=1 Tax=Henckelia pumila TaxID=405737 RepID=UPI003C6E7139
MIQVAAAGLSFYDTWPLHSFSNFYQYKTCSNVGYECSGKVVAVGSSVWNYEEGDEVCTILEGGGGCAEFIVVPCNHAMRIPSGVSLVAAAALPHASCLTTYILSVLTNIAPGKIILIHGDAGGFGIMAIQYFKYVGCQVIVAAETEEYLQLYKMLGAEVCINYNKEDFCERVKTSREKAGVNVILDVSHRDHFQKNLDCLAVGGTLISLGLKSNVHRIDIDLSILMKKDINVIGVDLRRQSFMAIESILSDAVGKLWPLIEAGHIKPIIGKVFNFSHATEAYRALKEQSIQGKILLVAQYD